jgi:hypothetical protein
LFGWRILFIVEIPNSKNKLCFLFCVSWNVLRTTMLHLLPDVSLTFLENSLREWFLAPQLQPQTIEIDNLLDEFASKNASVQVKNKWKSE